MGKRCRVSRIGAAVFTTAITGAILLSASAATASPVSGSASVSRSAAAAGSSDSLLDVVMLVDESGSETAQKVAAERATAATVAQSMLNPGSRVTIVGFGGVNHVTPNQDPVSVVCRPTVANGAANLAYLSACVNGLHRRSEPEADDTDYAAALGQAMTYFNPDTTYGQQSPPGAIKVVLMMTDGGVDVHRDTPQYGADWLAGEHTAVNQQLAAARGDAVQVWPLGFGTDITPADQSYLNYIAGQGAQATCDNRAASKPRAMVVQDPSKALSAMAQLYAAAACAAPATYGPDALRAGGSRTFQATLPPIASDAVISVDKGDPSVQVSFQQPDGKQWTDASAISGQDGTVEVLHLANPAPGPWQMTLTAPAGLSSQLVSATVLWQGAVRALITANPPSAQPGQPVQVTLTVLGPNGSPITDTAALAQLQTSVQVSGTGLSAPLEVPVTSKGGNAGSANGAGNYSGTFTTPKTPGSLTVTGTAAGYGLYATKIPATVQVGTSRNVFQGTVQWPIQSTVQTGQTISGKLIFTNPTGAGKQVLVTLTASHGSASLSSPAGTLTVPPGTPSVPFTVTVAKDSPTGAALLTLKVTDPSSGQAYASAPLDVTVTVPPSFLDKYKFELIGIGILIILVIVLLLWLRARRRHAIDVSDLYVTISRDGQPRGKEVKAPDRWAPSWTFGVKDQGMADERPVRSPEPGDSKYTVRRTGPGLVQVLTPDGEKADIDVGSTGRTLEDGLRVAFRDRRRRVRSGPPVRPGRGQRPDGGQRPGGRSPDGPKTPPPPPPAQTQPRKLSDW